jgi:hypothetical protein
MISKCANPDGSNPFRYLQGRKAGCLRQANQIPGSGTIDSSLPGCVGAVRQRSRSASRQGGDYASDCQSQRLLAVSLCGNSVMSLKTGIRNTPSRRSKRLRDSTTSGNLSRWIASGIASLPEARCSEHGVQTTPAGPGSTLTHRELAHAQAAIFSRTTFILA